MSSWRYIMIGFLLGLAVALLSGCEAHMGACVSFIDGECRPYYRTGSPTYRTYYSSPMYYRYMYPPVTVYPGGR